MHNWVISLEQVVLSHRKSKRSGVSAIQTARTNTRRCSAAPSGAQALTRHGDAGGKCRKTPVCGQSIRSLQAGQQSLTLSVPSMRTRPHIGMLAIAVASVHGGAAHAGPAAAARARHGRAGHRDLGAMRGQRLRLGNRAGAALRPRPRPGRSRAAPVRRAVRQCLPEALQDGTADLIPRRLRMHNAPGCMDCHGGGIRVVPRRVSTATQCAAKPWRMARRCCGASLSRWWTVVLCVRAAGVGRIAPSFAPALKRAL